MERERAIPGAPTVPAMPAVPTPVTLRPATTADLAAVAAVERLAFSDPWSEHAFAQLLDRPEIHFVVAEQAADPAQGTTGGAAVVGYAVAWFVVGEGEVANIAVHPACRGRRVGASLLDDVLATAARQGVSSVFLEVRESNVPARALYTSRGFHPVGRRRHYYRAPVEDALILRRDQHDDGERSPAP